MLLKHERFNNVPVTFNLQPLGNETK